MSFGREIKDFIGAFDAGQKIAGSSDDRAYKKLRNQVLKAKADQAADPDYVKLSKDRLQAQINRLNRPPRAVDPALTQGRALSNRLRELQIKALENPPSVPGPADDVPAYGAPPGTVAPAAPAAPKAQSAIDVEQPYQAADAGDDDIYQEAAARGGLITRKGYADGGEVEDDTSDDGDTQALADEQTANRMDAEDAADGNDDEDAEGESALPVRTASAAPAAAPAAASGSTTYSPQAAHDAVVAGLSYAGKTTGHHGQDGAVATGTSARARGSRAYYSGAGAASHDEMTKVSKAIDPEGKMSEAQRNMAALSTVYEWNLKKNDPVGADRAAASMMQYFRVASDRYKAIAAAAAEHGDVDNAMKATMRAYANIPDGKDLKLEKTQDGKIQYSFTDTETGKTVSGGVATPEQMLEFASRGSMHTFDDVLSSSAAGRAQLAATAGAKAKDEAAKAKAAPKPLKPSDNKAINEAISNAVTDAVADPADDLKSADPKQLTEIKGTTFQMLAANPGIAPSDALRATREMTQVDPADPTKRTFKTVGPVQGGVKFQLSNGAYVVLPDEMIPRIKTLRDKNVAVTTKKLADAKASAKRTGETIDAATRLLTPSTVSPEEMAARKARAAAGRRGYATQGALPVNSAAEQ